MYSISGSIFIPAFSEKKLSKISFFFHPLSECYQLFNWSITNHNNLTDQQRENKEKLKQ